MNGADISERVVALLDRWMAARVKDEDKPDYHPNHKIADALGIPRMVCREYLDVLASQGRIKREAFSNGIRWRSINPLPHEPGGYLRQRFRHTVTVEIEVGYGAKISGEAVRQAITSALNYRSGEKVISVNVSPPSTKGRES